MGERKGRREGGREGGREGERSWPVYITLPLKYTQAASWLVLVHVVWSQSAGSGQAVTLPDPLSSTIAGIPLIPDPQACCVAERAGRPGSSCIPHWLAEYATCTCGTGIPYLMLGACKRCAGV